MDESKGNILVVDDEKTIRNAVARQLKAAGYNCVCAEDGKSALWEAFMQDFDLVLTDIKMPGMSGMEVLAQMVNDHPDTGIIMITGVNTTVTAVDAMRKGAYDYVTKPFNLEDLVMRVERALERRKLILENREYQIRLEQKVEQQVGEIQQYYREAIQSLVREEIVLNDLEAQKKKAFSGAHDDEIYLQMVRLLAQIAETHELYARGHSERVELLSRDIANEMGASKKLIKELELAAYIHDAGKIMIPDHILNKPGPLTPAEFHEVKRHPSVAADFMRGIEYFHKIIPLVESHHEWYNGKGYPNRLKSEAIPLGARILAVADAYDAMTCSRPYRARIENENALEILKEGSAKQWDPTVVDSFLRVQRRENRMLKLSSVAT